MVSRMNRFLAVVFMSCCCISVIQAAARPKTGNNRVQRHVPVEGSQDGALMRPAGVGEGVKAIMELPPIPNTADMARFCFCRSAWCKKVCNRICNNCHHGWCKKVCKGRFSNNRVPVTGRQDGALTRPAGVEAWPGVEPVIRKVDILDWICNNCHHEWCKKVCKDVKPRTDICLLPADPGLCLAAIPAFYYNSAAGDCEHFLYGGCGGNGNHFRTREACRARCGGNNRVPVKGSQDRAPWKLATDDLVPL